MLSDHTIILINVTCIVFLLIMLVVLGAATRMKGGGGWAALIMITTCVPVYLLYLVLHDFFPASLYLSFLYPAIFLNMLCLPSLWFFTRTQLDKSFRFTAGALLHLAPALISLIAHIAFYAPLTAEQVDAERILMKTGGINLPDNINNILMYLQLFTYYPAIFWYIRKRKKYLKDNYSDSEYLEIIWVPRFLLLWFVLFLIIGIAYVVNPAIYASLIPILNVIVMTYLVYCVIRHSTAAYINRLPETANSAKEPLLSSTGSASGLSAEQMKEICDSVTGYLQKTGRYKDKDLSLSTLALETGVHHKKISTAINGYLHKNFFELINAMRVDEAKCLLRTLNTANYTIESIYALCGFQSRSSFFMTFKKFEGTTPAQWLKNNSNTDKDTVS